MHRQLNDAGKYGNTNLPNISATPFSQFRYVNQVGGKSVTRDLTFPNV